MSEDALHIDAEELLARWRQCCFRRGAPNLKDWWDAMSAKGADVHAIGPPPCPICNPPLPGTGGSHN